MPRCREGQPLVQPNIPQGESIMINNRIRLLCSAICAASLSAQQFQAHGPFLSPSSPSFIPRKVLAADFNGDGRMDLAVVRDDGLRSDIEVALASGSAASLSGRFNSVSAPPPNSLRLNNDPQFSGDVPNNEALMVVADLGGSPLPDIAVPNDAGSIMVWENITAVGATVPSFRPLLPLTASTSLTDIIATDLDGDSRPDLVCSNPGSILVFRNQAAAGVSFGTNHTWLIPVSGGTSQTPRSLRTHDADRDGISDFLLIARDGSTGSAPSLECYRIQRIAPGQLPSFVALFTPITIPASPCFMRLADVNGDAVDDVVVGCSMNANQPNVLVQLLASPGAGSLAPLGPPLRLTTVASTTVGEVRSMTLADVDADGKVDIVAVIDAPFRGFPLIAFLNRDDGNPANGPEFSANSIGIPTSIAGTSTVPDHGVCFSVTAADMESGNGPAVMDLIVTGDSPSTALNPDVRILENRGILPWAAFGQGCNGSGGQPSLNLVTPAIRGQSYSIAIRNLPPSGGLMVIAYGGSNVSLPGVGPLPINGSPFGAPGCMLRVSLDACYAYLVPSTFGTQAHSIAVPNTPAMLGVVFFNQALVWDSPANSLGVTVSNACQARIL
jgi:hypothetical protein